MGSGVSGYRIGTVAGRGSTAGSRDRGFRTVRGHSTELHKDAQGKHIPGHKNYDASKHRSIFKGSLSDAQDLITSYAGSGTWVTANKEIVDCGHTIGTWVSKDGSQRLATSRGTIHYGKNGAHIVPAYPKGD